MMSPNLSLTSTAVALLSKFLIVIPGGLFEGNCDDKGASCDDLTLTRSISHDDDDSDNHVEPPDGTVPGAFPDSEEDTLDRQYLQYLQQQKEEEHNKRLERQASKELQEKLSSLRQEAVAARCRQTQEIKRIDEHLLELSTVQNLNGMVGPAPTSLAFSSKKEFVRPRSDMEMYASAPPRDSPINCAYSTSVKKLSLYESAPGSRWPKRLSAERNCGFAGGVRSGLRRDAVNAEEERARKTIGQTSRIAVPTGLQEAIGRGQVIGVSSQREDHGIDKCGYIVPDAEDDWVTDDEDEDGGERKTEGISNIKIERRVAEKVDDVIVRQVGVKKWSLEEHMRKRQEERHPRAKRIFVPDVS